MQLLSPFCKDISKLILFFLPNKQRFEILVEDSRLKNEGICVLDNCLIKNVRITGDKTDKIIEKLLLSPYSEAIKIDGKVRLRIPNFFDFYTDLIIQTTNNEEVNVKINMENIYVRQNIENQKWTPIDGTVCTHIFTTKGT